MPLQCIWTSKDIKTFFGQHEKVIIKTALDQMSTETKDFLVHVSAT